MPNSSVNNDSVNDSSLNDTSVIDSPFGRLKLIAQNNQLEKIELNSPDQLSSSKNQSLQKVEQQLNSYFKTSDFTFELTVLPQGTDFQNRVWNALKSIPVSEVWTYGQLAKKLNTSARAVGNACRNNPTPIIVPCHRIVSATGLGGFAGKTEGILSDIKRQMLRHEGVNIDG